MLKKSWFASGAVLSMLLIAGCSGDPSSSEASNENTNGEGPTEIEFYHIHGGEAGEAVDELVAEYHEQQDDVRVTPVYVEGSYEGMLEKLQMQATSGELPAVAQAGFVYSRFMIENMPVAPIQDFIDEENYNLDDYYPKMLDLGRDDEETIWSLPFAVSTPVVYYNKDWFEEAGLDPENPPLDTWEDVRDTASVLAEEDGKYGVFYNHTITGNWMFQAMTETAGGRMVNDDATEVTFNEEPGVKSLQYWVDLVNKDQSMPNVNNDQAVQAFNSEELGIYINTTASLRQLQTNSEFEVGTAPFPTVDGHDRQVPAGGNSVYIMDTDEAQKQAAWDFIKFLTNPEGTTTFSSASGYMAVRESAVEQDELLGKYLNEENPAAKTTYEQTDEMVPWFNFPGDAGTRIYKIVQDNIQAALTEQKTAEEALQDAAEEANQLIEK
ncbi:ABC transporter substrate-binding protein [Alteribacillus iranensis]|uniref:Multiple sugar transport system substrate-binding protein n=1 Tax=Alteribacillus iranensis TaxID=930128 RepID=A0A1I2BIT7_9BACI|nr:ABC transporter substrate-binding protein [Alteribacillus iranensis]SFE56104.1 multiple sugar transport system substrate-binding protein [Alteribacillus iranensis]